MACVLCLGLVQRRCRCLPRWRSFPCGHNLSAELQVQCKVSADAYHSARAAIDVGGLANAQIGLSEATVLRDYHVDAEDRYNVTCDFLSVVRELTDPATRFPFQVGTRPSKACTPAPGASWWWCYRQHYM